MQVHKQAHLAMLMALVTDVVTGTVKLPPIIVPGVAILGANMLTPTNGDLLAAKVTRCVRSLSSRAEWYPSCCSPARAGNLVLIR